MDAFTQLAHLLRSRPGPDDPDSVWAEWFDAKADVFDAVAAGCPDLAVEAQAFAFTARAMASDYRETFDAAAGMP